MDIVRDTTAFHVKFGLGVQSKPVASLSEEVWAHRMRMTKEECGELVEALEMRDWKKIARESIDVIFVVVGTLVVMGIPFWPVWRAVMKANMAKEPGVGNSMATKPTKPPGWESPDRDIQTAFTLAAGAGVLPNAPFRLSDKAAVHVSTAVGKAQGDSGLTSRPR